MSITETFDRDGKELICPTDIVKKIDGFPETVVSVFSQKFAEIILNSLQHDEISYMSCGGIVPVYRINYNGNEFGFYRTILGGAASAALLEEIFAKGAKRVLFFGSCGSLDKEITSGHLIVPTAAYRDEGTSYHYTEASDFIDISSADKLADVFDEIRVPYIRTKTWTTDCFYRETQKNFDARKKVGCAVVEMECASVMSVGQFRKKEVFQFLYAADCLDGGDWDKRILGNMPDDMRERIIKVALETAVRLDESGN